MVGGMTGSPQILFPKPLFGPLDRRWGTKGFSVNPRQPTFGHMVLDDHPSGRRTAIIIMPCGKDPSPKNTKAVSRLKADHPWDRGVFIVHTPVALLRVPSPLVGGHLPGGGITGLLETNHDQSQDARLNFLYFSLINQMLIGP
jgi:hypothetical protein